MQSHDNPVGEPPRKRYRGVDLLALVGLSTFMTVLSIFFFVRAGAATAQHTPIFFRYPLLARGGTSMDPWQAVVAGILCLVLSLLAVLWALRKPKE
jgi:hypothetical protein